jgi:glycosyltransferase involved in cell wall biosynthesis
VSEFERGHFAARLRLSPDRFEVIPNGSDLPFAPPAPQEAEPGPLILSVGRLERYKGHHRAIAALPPLLEREPCARLRIVGSGPYESQLRRLAERLGVSGHVEIGEVPPGDRRGMARVLSRASLVVLLSEYESQGIAALEALALGRPVLVAETSALRELDRYDLARTVPLRVAPGDLARTMLRQMGAAPGTPGVAMPSWDECADRILAVYRSVARPRDAG